jgi:hypothetical protein
MVSYWVVVQIIGFNTASAEDGPLASRWWMRRGEWRRHIPEPAGSDPGADRAPRGRATVRNWPIAPVAFQGSPQTVCEPGESPKRLRQLISNHSFSTKQIHRTFTAQNCAEAAQNLYRSDLGPAFIGTLVPNFKLVCAPYCANEAAQVPASLARLAHAPQRRGPEIPALHALRRISGEVHADGLQGS